MKSGNKKIEYKSKFSLKEFSDMHADLNCKGHFNITLTSNQRFTIDSLGPVLLPWIPMVTCHTCHTSYELPKFRVFIEHLIAHHLVTTKALLAKKQIKFLRLFFDKTQEEFALNIGVATKSDMSKFESEESGRTLDADRQIRLKLYCAKLLKIEEAKLLYDMHEVDDTKIADIPISIFPPEEQASKVMDSFHKVA